MKKKIIYYGDNKYFVRLPNYSTNRYNKSKLLYNTQHISLVSFIEVQDNEVENVVLLSHSPHHTNTVMVNACILLYTLVSGAISRLYFDLPRLNLTSFINLDSIPTGTNNVVCILIII